MSGSISHTAGRCRSIVGSRHRSAGTGEAGGTTANCRSSLLCAGNSSRDEVMSLKSLLAEQRSVNNAKTVDTHVPMSVDEAAEYLGIPKGTLYMKLSEGTIPATKPGKRYCLYRDELDKWLETARKNPIPLSDEELNKSLSSSHRRKPNPRNW